MLINQIADRNRGEPPTAKHSQFGLASTAIGVVAICIICIGLSYTALSADTGNPASPKNQGIISGLILASISFPVTIMGIILGIVGVYERNTRRLFSVVGIALNGIVLIGYSCAMATFLFVVIQRLNL